MDSIKVGLGITSKCNLGCSFCYSKKQRLHNDLPLQSWMAFFDTYGDHIAEVNFGTGENPLEESWFELVEHIHRTQPHIVQALTTNGSLSTMVGENGGREEIVSRGISEIDVSVDLADENDHDAFRGKAGSYRAAVDTLELCRRHGITSTIVMLGIERTLNPHNLSGIFQLAKRYKSLVRINLYRPVVAGVMEPPSFLTILRAFDWIAENHVMCSLSDPLFSAIFTTGERQADHSGNGSIRILPDGNIFPSTYLIQDRYRSMNITDADVFDRLDGYSIFKEIRNAPMPKACRSCEVFDRCRGGVVDRRYLWYGSLEYPDPYCPKRMGLPTSIRRYTVGDPSFSSVHDGYLPTLFFRPR